MYRQMNMPGIDAESGAPGLAIAPYDTDDSEQETTAIENRPAAQLPCTKSRVFFYSLRVLGNR